MLKIQKPMNTIVGGSTLSPRRVPMVAQRTSHRCFAAREPSIIEKIMQPITEFMTNSPVNEGKKMMYLAMAGQYDEAQAKTSLEKYISDNKVMVFSLSSCPFCNTAKGVLDDMKVEYTALEFDQAGDEGKGIRAELIKKTSRTSVPNIFINGEGIGGCNDGPGLMTLKNNGKLMPMLEAAGAVKKN